MFSIPGQRRYVVREHAKTSFVEVDEKASKEFVSQEQEIVPHGLRPGNVDLRLPTDYLCIERGFQKRHVKGASGEEKQSMLEEEKKKSKK